MNMPDGSRQPIRGWVAAGQPNVLQGPGFLYRPRQILLQTGPSWAPLVATRLEQEGGVPDEELNSGFERAKLSVRGYLMPPEVNIPELVAQLREHKPGEPVPNVAPNHVFCGEADYHGGPFGQPQNATPLDEKPYAKPDPGAPGIAVLDTGYDLSVPALHPGLGWRVGYPPGTQENPISGGYITQEGGHGTFIDGVLMRLAPEVPIWQVNVLNPAGITDDACVSQAIPLANAPVINLSLGGYTQGDTPPPASSQALAQLDPDVAVVAAAGNNASSEPFWPAAFDRVVAVGALDTTSGPPALASFSNFSDPDGWVDIYAPGVGVRSTYLEANWKQPPDTTGWFIDGWAFWNGTSFAAPQVAAAIAEKMRQQPGLTAAQAAQLILSAAPSLPGPAGGPWHGGRYYIPQPGVVG